jgi:glucan 1,3-beta-glucosidase
MKQTNASRRFPLLALALATSTATESSWYGRTAHPPGPGGSGFRSVTSFGAKGDGVSDDTTAIQAAIDANRGSINAKAAAIVYFPPGSYLVSDTLIMWANTELRGSSVPTAPSTLRLAPHAPGFNDTAALKPLIATTSGYNQPTAYKKWWDNSIASNCIFYMHVHQLTLDISASGNSGAVGLYWCVAQQTSLRNLNFLLGGAYSAVDICVSEFSAHAGGGGNGGGGTIEDVAITGGEVGIRADSSQWALRGLRISGQRKTAVLLQDMIWTFAFSDFVVHDAPAAIQTKAGLDEASSFVTVVDAVFSNISGPAAILLGGSQGSPVMLQNVSLLPPLPTAVVAAGDTPWLPTQTSVVARWAGWGGGSSDNALFVGGKALPSPTSALPGAPAASPFAAAATSRPWLDDLDPASICNAVADCAADNLGARDATAALQACLDRCAAVFLPYGVYVVSNTLRASAARALVGEQLTNIFLAPHSPGFGDPGAPKPLLDTPDDAAAAVRLAGLSLGAGPGNNGTTLLRWRSGGEGGGLWDVNVNISSNVFIGLHATGHAAGVIANSWVWGADHSWWSMAPMSEDHAEVGVLFESAGPVVVFGLMSEHHRRAMISFQGASNHHLLTVQTEQAVPIEDAAATVHLQIGNGTSNVTIYGALACNWWSPQVDALATAFGVGGGVSVFSLRDRGSANGGIQQPGTPGLPLPASGGWYSLSADVNIPA